MSPRLIFAVFAITLAACGGGGASSSIPPSETNIVNTQALTTPTPSANSVPTQTPSAKPTSTPAATPTPTPTPLTIPYFKSSFIYAGRTYPYTMVGSNPMTNATSTTIPVEVIPVELTFSDATTLDATHAVSGMPNSPLFVNGSYAAGTTQYGDAVMRSEFWKYVSAKNYHVLLGTPLIEPTIRETVPMAEGYTKTLSNGSKTGFVTFSWFVKTIEPQIIQQLRIDPRTLAVFATYRTKVIQPNGYCCYSGYHGAFQLSTAYGSAIATTAWASVSSTSVETLSHEVAEWLNDPFYTNITPRWVQPGSNACGGSDLEVGDPVTRFTFIVNGYAVQDEAFYSWFSRDMPSLGINGQYDLLGKLTTPAPVCA